MCPPSAVIAGRARWFKRVAADTKQASTDIVALGQRRAKNSSTAGVGTQVYIVAWVEVTAAGAGARLRNSVDVACRP